MLVGNKADNDCQKIVSTENALDFAKQYGM